MLENKISLGTLIAVLIQGAAIIWWASQITSSVEVLNKEVTEIKEHSTRIEMVHLKRDIQDINKELEKMRETLTQHADNIYYSATIDELNNLAGAVNELSRVVDSNKFRLENLQ